MKHRRASLLLTAAIAVGLIACGDDTGTGATAGSGGDGGSGGSGAAGGGTGGTTDGGGGAGGGEGGMATTGPIEAEPNVWTFVEFPTATCMDGSSTGIGVNINPDSDDVVIFLMGGNACFNLGSCLIVANKDGYDSAKFDNDVEDFLSQSDYFDRTNEANPFKDFSYVFVPYCTGDVHAGEKADVEIANNTYQFHGFTNMSKYLERVVPTFSDATRVVLTGVSAGGFGAAYNYDQVATAFGADVPVTLLDDSGPPMGTEFVPACLQAHFIETWGVDQTWPSDCTECTNDLFLEPYVNYILDKYPERSLGVISSEGDETIRSFWGYGNDNCANLNGGPPPYDPAKYKQGLEDLRDRIGANGTLRLFMVPGTEHVFVDNGLGAVTVDGVTLEEWMVQAIDEDPKWPNVSAP